MRLLTRSDFDGLVCGALLKELGVIDHWKFVHPKDIQDGLVEVSPDDVLANIPYVKGCGLWFDHHTSEHERLGDIQFEGESRLEDSAARVIYEYYGGKSRLPNMEEMVIAVDKVDAAKLTVDEILHPKDWVLLGYLMDPRTGLGRFRNFRISNYDLMAKLIDACREQSIDRILADPDVAERIVLYKEQNEQFKEMVLKHTRTDGNVIISDLRGVETIYTGNRFLVYSLFPEQNISLWIVDGRAKLNVAIAVGHSVINRTSKTNVGSLLLEYNGGGHRQVGTCQVPYNTSDQSIAKLVARIKADG
ncbi:MAG: exopolyphosphatase [Syntrophorhabdaceae bacterium]|nr:exopolyphosphatase [Syntrophorhabdaceae bacterium]